jgi:hypothetical protein
MVPKIKNIIIRYISSKALVIQ